MPGSTSSARRISLNRPAFLIGAAGFLISALAAAGCSDPTPPPHALLPGQSNQITQLAPSAPAQAPVPGSSTAAQPELGGMAANPAMGALPAAMPSAASANAAAPQTVAALGSGFTDLFDRPQLGPDWFNTGAPYHTEKGPILVYSMAHNHPLWLNRSLPRNVKVEFDCTALSPDGDVKVELFGDGHSFESADEVQRDAQYTASGYVFIFGGWKNHLSTLVKQQEHAWQYDPTVPRDTTTRVVPGRSYHWTITRADSPAGAHLEWQLDGKKFMSWDDPQPLDGPGHDRFAFEGWESPAACSKLKIVPLL